MTISLITAGVIAALLIIALLGLAAWARSSAETARTNGYDQGYDDAKRTYGEYNASLEEQLARNVGRLAQAKREHDAMLQDADRRIAIYAGRSWNSEDLTAIRRGAKQLKLAAITYSQLTTNQMLELSDQARHALTVCGQLEQVAQRIEEQLEGAEPTPAPAAQSLRSEAETAILEAAAYAATVPNGKSWLVHGPARCGKTHNAQAIADALGLTEIVDDWQPGQPIPLTKALVLTNDPGPHRHFTRRAPTFAQAMSLVAAKAKQGVAA